MKIESRSLERALRSAQQQEVVDSNDQLMADLHNVLTPEAVEAGVYIDFGADRDALARVIEVLEVSDAIKRGEAHLHQGFVYTPGIESYIGKALPVFQGMGLVDAVDTLQADRWHSFKQVDIYPHMGLNDDWVTSQVLVANTTWLDGERAADITKPGLVIGASYRYLPEFNMEEYEEFGPSLARFFEDNIDNYMGSGDKIHKLAMAMLEYDRQPKMPDSSYYLKVGSLAKSSMFALGDVEVNWPMKYIVERGRVVAETRAGYEEEL